MSWSVSTSGSKAEVLKYVAEQFDAAANNYLSQGIKEGSDVAIMRAVTIGAIQTLLIEEGGTVEVNCYGSRSDQTYMTASLSVKAVGAKAK